MQGTIRNVLAILTILLLTVIGLGLAIWLVFNTSTTEVRTDVVTSQFSNYSASAEVYRGRYSNYAGLCRELTIPREVQCADQADSYRLSTRLSDGTHYCADSKNFAGVVTYQPSGVACQ